MEKQCTACPAADEKIESSLASPWLSKMSNRLPFSIFIVFVCLLALKPLIINRLISRAEAYSSYGRFVNTERECKKVLFLDPDNQRAWNELGNSFESRGDLENAVTTYLNAININQSNRFANYRVAMVFASQKSFSRAIFHLEYIRSLGPETIEQLDGGSSLYYREALVKLALFYEKMGNPEKMKSVLDELEKNYPGYRKILE